jgi:putative transposase
MSRKGDCYDNAAMESFCHSVNVEQVNDCRYPTREEAKADVFGYIEAYYNSVRWHSALNSLSPRAFENRYNLSTLMSVTLYPPQRHCQARVTTHIMRIS